ncbi:MAG: Uma2 family endonuclease [Candidatus Schekmanbacteria bacterium]|nr:Uma2 family endonuclease [Candidatus Schekmanbacteria bacterium]
MSTAAIQERLITADEFERIAHRYGRSELIDGRIVQLSPTGWKHGDIEAQIILLLRPYVRRQQLGFVGTGEVGCRLPNGRVRAPDVLFVRQERLVGLPEDGFLPFAPDLAVEVVSPDDSPREVRDNPTIGSPPALRPFGPSIPPPAPSPSTRSPRPPASSASARLSRAALFCPASPAPWQRSSARFARAPGATVTRFRPPARPPRPTGPLVRDSWPPSRPR